MDYLGLASKQHGMVARDQLIELGLTKSAIEHRIKTKQLVYELPGVYRVVGAQESWKQKAMAACLWGGEGTVVSHSAAARLWGLPGFDKAPVELCSPRNLTKEGLRIRRRSTPAENRTVVDGIPVTDALTTLIDLGSVATEQQVADAIDAAVKMRAVTGAELVGATNDCGRGRRGSKIFRRVVADYDVRVLATESVFEARLLRVLKRAKLPLPIPQYVIKDDAGKFVARVDFAYLDAKVIIEAEGFVAHASPRDHRRDAHRYNRLRDLGWEIIRVTWQDLEDPRDLIRRIRKLLSPSLHV